MLGRLASSAGALGQLFVQQLASSGASAGLVQRAAAASGNGLLQLCRRTFATNSHDIFNIHKHTPDNNWNTDFDFTPANYKKVDGVAGQHRITLHTDAGVCTTICVAHPATIGLCGDAQLQ